MRRIVILVVLLAGCGGEAHNSAARDGGSDGRAEAALPDTHGPTISDPTR